MIIDTHAHLYWDSFKDDFDQVVKRALDNGITAVINVGVNVELSKKAAELESDKIKFYATIGIHPHEADKFSSDQIDSLEEIYKSTPEKIVAVGECGLDYKEAGDQIKQLQKQLFQAQIDLAKKLSLLLIVHCRDDRSKDPQNSEAWDEVLKMVGDHPAILHCYSGLPKTTTYLLQTTNFYVSFAGNLTYPKNEYLKEAVRMIPLDRILIETDCPFLPPQKYRGQRNEPIFIKEVIQKIAEIKNLTPDEVEQIVYNNTKQLLKV